ncbi:MAG: ThiF family adenylyltransferase [Pseudomonadota bacterium]
MKNFTYEEFTNRNIGFVTSEQQEKLKNGTVFVCGTGGMGGACAMGLARAGVGNLVLADIDEFEISNLNRQVFAFADTVGKHKAQATRDICLTINPEMKITVYESEWPDHVEESVRNSAIVINGTDDLGASLLLYRTARKFGKAVVDAYASPLPSVYVTQANAKSPEERLGYPTLNTKWDCLNEAQCSEAFLREAEYVILHSSSRKYIDLDLAGEVAAGKRSRMSFAPMVITTGMLMTYEAVAGLLDKPHGADNQGWFFNPYAARVEKPKNALIAAILRPIVRKFLTDMMKA